MGKSFLGLLVAALLVQGGLAHAGPLDPGARLCVQPPLLPI